jgi:hypothetical protein
MDAVERFFVGMAHRGLYWSVRDCRLVHALSRAHEMAALGIALMITGVALVGGGVILWHRASRAEPSEPDNAGELRAMIDALEEEDKRIDDGLHPRRTRSVLPRDRYSDSHDLK